MMYNSYSFNHPRVAIISSVFTESVVPQATLQSGVWKQANFKGHS